MAHFIKKAFQLIPNQLLYQQKRYRGKINIRKPKISFKKRVLNELLTPFFINPNKDKTLDQLCKNATKKIEHSLGIYDTIIAREVRNWFDNSKMIAVLHVNSIMELDVFDIKVALFKENMHYKRYGSHIVHNAIKNSPYENLAPLISNFTAFVFSSEIKVPIVNKIIKKSKKMYILGGVLEGQVLKYDDFLKFGEMDITMAQSNLVQVLQNAGGVNLTRQLTHHQSTLLTRLKQIGTNETTSDDKKSVPV
ncbi:39S ribosomal protein L10, mitochondrial [Apis laboriosa]|uniref:39S ribosomal protein L10, mitochondrial n=1 Tax=Apis laboriosa TaxID=183418 RepID=UPI001CC539FA|nr:39S ribosomal protein L10, mitochondrial [Apis laboriosa]